MDGHRVGLAGVLLAVVLFGGSQTADAATLKASYQLQNSRASEVLGAPNLVDLGPGNRFSRETLDGVERSVLAFPAGGGVSLATSGLVDRRNHSIVLVFRLAGRGGYRRILDFTNGTSDNGLYNFGGRAVLYVNGDVATSANGVFNDAYVQLVLTNAADTGSSQNTVVYINGRQVAAARTTQGFDLESNVLRFFKDNTSGPAPGEESAGAVICVRVYDGVLTAAEVQAGAEDQAVCAAPEAPAGKPEALAPGRAWARRHKKSFLVDTGLAVSCPIGSAPCRLDGRVATQQLSNSRTVRLGSRSLSLPAGTTRHVRVKLSRRGARALRDIGKLGIRVSATVTAPGGAKARVKQKGRIELPRRATFDIGNYMGRTSQGLPISFAVSQSGVDWLQFRWRALCADGRTHVNTIFLGGARLHGGRFSVGGELNTLGMAHVDGLLRGERGAGMLSRWRSSAFDTDCVAMRIRWHARRSKTDATGPSPLPGRVEFPSSPPSDWAPVGDIAQHVHSWPGRSRHPQ